jgi:large subunit ribosomal protein L25
MEATLNATSRDTLGRNSARRLRRTGWIPAVLYGGSQPGERAPAQPIRVDPKVLSRILHSQSGVNTLIGLTVDGGAPTRVMVREFQLDPVSHHLLHADFYRIAMDKTIRVTVPVVVKGEAEGVKVQGGLLDFVHREIEVECLPADIPERVEVDVTPLLIGQAVRVRDLVPAGAWRATTDADTMLVHVIPPKAEEAAPEAAAAAVAGAPATPAEPELIKKGKAEQAEEED